MPVPTQRKPITCRVCGAVETCSCQFDTSTINWRERTGLCLNCAGSGAPQPPPEPEEIMEFTFNTATPFSKRLRFNHVKLGAEPTTEEMVLMQRCRQAHPDALFVLWNDERVEAERSRLNLPVEYDDWDTRADKAWTPAQRATAKSDVLRIAIPAMDPLPGEEDVFELYADLDIVWDKDIRSALGGVAAFVARRVDTGLMEICNAVLGADAGHPFFKHVLRCLPGTTLWNYAAPLWTQVGSDVLYRALQFGQWPGVTVFPSRVFFPYTMEERGKGVVPDLARYAQDELHLATHLFGGGHLGRTLPPLALPALQKEG